VLWCRRVPAPRWGSAISLVLIAAGAPALGASFSLAFGLLGTFCFVVFWLTRLLQRQEEFL